VLPLLNSKLGRFELLTAQKQHEKSSSKTTMALIQKMISSVSKVNTIDAGKIGALTLIKYCKELSV
jgi:hydroxymethylpyrimidine/phosphomethylpyrimidine kinase